MPTKDEYRRRWIYATDRIRQQETELAEERGAVEGMAIRQRALMQDLEVTEARLVAQREGYERRIMASIQACDQVHTSLHTAMRQVSAHEHGLTRGCPQCESRFLDGQELAEPERAEL